MHQFFAHPTAPNEAERADRLLPEGEVLGDGQARKYGGILVDDMESDGAQKRGSWRCEFCALKKHLAAGRRMDAGEDLDDGRFARAVLAKKRVESARLQLQIDVAQRDGRAKSLGDVAQLQKRNAA